jgi:hypothetical protein
MYTIKNLDYQDQSKIRTLLAAHGTARGQSLDDFQTDYYSVLNFDKIDNIIERYIPQLGSEIITDRLATAIFDDSGEIVAIALSRQLKEFPAWSLSMIISNPLVSMRQRSACIARLVKWLLKYHEDLYYNECWCAIPLKKYLTYEHFHKYFPGRYSLTTEAVCKQGSRPPFHFYWILIGQTMPENDIALIRWSLKPEHRTTQNFENLYATL